MNICIYGSSSNEIDRVYMEKTEALGSTMAHRGHTLVFGGGARGLMGAAARGMSSGSGNIIGVAPSFFNINDILYKGCTELILTETMRQRKQIMEEKSDAFIVTPGGIGTFEEFFEILTLKQLGRHSKPIAVYNINGYYNSIMDVMKRAADDKFMSKSSINLCKFFDDHENLLDYLESYKPENFISEKLK